MKHDGGWRLLTLTKHFILLFRLGSVSLLLLGDVTAATVYRNAQQEPHWREPLASLPHPPSQKAELVALGSRLFNDTILSGDGGLACTSCHDLNGGGSVNSKRTVGYKGKMHRFNAPTIFNVGNNYRLGWRGDFTSLEAQNEKVLLDENLMAAKWPDIISRLRNSPIYRPAFESVFGRTADQELVLQALAAFQRSLVTLNSPFDRYLRNDAGALNAEEKNGYELFKSYGCASCHQGSNIGGNMFQKFGIFTLPQLSGNDGDLGRWTTTGDDEDRGVFRVPSLRNVEVSGPYFHDGRVATLHEAVDVMARSQLGRQLPAPDVDAIVAFLKTLTGDYNGRKLSASPPQKTP
jgi:cytochrome c peroxidase